MSNRKCIFCGSDKMSGEHAYPDWLANYFGRKLMSTNVVTNGRGETRSWKSRIFQNKIFIVCDDCNHGWMNMLETGVSGVLGPMASHGKTTKLTDSQQKLLAFWAVKTMYVLTHIYSGTTNNIPSEHLRDLYRLKSPVPGSGVFIAFRENRLGDTGKQAAGFSMNKLQKLKIKTPADLGFLERQKNKGRHFYTASIVVGHVQFILLGHNFIDTDVLGKLPRGYIQMIWPQPEHSLINWPTTMPVELLGGWSEAYRHFAENIYAEKYREENQELKPF